MKCLTDVIGITRSDCVCITANLPEGYNTGQVFLDEVSDFPINLAMFKQPGECNTMASILTKARDAAYTDFSKDIFKLIQTRYKNKDVSFNGTVGSKNFNANLVTGSTYAGLEITAMPYKGAVMYLKGMYTAFNFTGTLDVTILKSYAGDLDTFTVVETLTLNTVNGVITPNAIDPIIELPLYDKSGQQIKYFFRYETSAGAIQPKNNDVSCGCGNVENTAKNYIEWSGFATNLAGTLESLSYYPGYMMGLIPEIEIKCGSTQIICDEYNSSETLKTVVNDLLAYKAASNAIYSLLKNDVINRYTMMDPEKLGWMASSLKKKYNNDLQWFSENMDVAAFDCFLCKPEADIYSMGSIKL